MHEFFQCEDIKTRDNLVNKWRDKKISQTKRNNQDQQLLFLFPNCIAYSFNFYHPKYIIRRLSSRTTKTSHMSFGYANLLFKFANEGVLLYFWKTILNPPSKSAEELICKFVTAYVEKYGKISLIEMPTRRTNNALLALPTHECTQFSFTFDTQHLNTTQQIFIVVYLVVEYCYSMNAALDWNDRLFVLIVRKGVLAQENLFCAILGAAYAAMTRDSMNKEHAIKARAFAQRQFYVGKRLGDITLQRRALVYISYYYMFKKQYKKAETILKKQVSDEDEEIFGLAHAALVRLQQLQDSESK